MAYYQFRKHLFRVKDQAFSNELMPGGIAPFGGIYRCVVCGREVAVEMGLGLPEGNHHQHTAPQGEIRWKLIIYADPREK